MARQINKIGEFTDLLDTDLLADTFMPAALPDFSSPSSFSLPPDMTASASGITGIKIRMTVLLKPTTTQTFPTSLAISPWYDTEQ
ncbi:MAG TPA: hypothetical protein PKG49_09620 [Nitrosomonas mobilis]|nr:hypothetical protein [Nitrosomonas mobilis]